MCVDTPVMLRKKERGLFSGFNTCMEKLCVSAKIVDIFFLLLRKY